MSHLDNLPGNANGSGMEAIMRATDKTPLSVGEAVFFAVYSESPRIVDWVRERGHSARYEQRADEGVTIVIGAQRAYVGDWIITCDDTIRVTRYTIQDVHP